MNQPQAPQRQVQTTGTLQNQQYVVVNDINISFGNMVMLLVKLAFASIPAVIIIWMVFAILGVLMMTVFGVGGAIFGGL